MIRCTGDACTERETCERFLVNDWEPGEEQRWYSVPPAEMMPCRFYVGSKTNLPDDFVLKEELSAPQQLIYERLSE